MIHTIFFWDFMLFVFYFLFLNLSPPHTLITKTNATETSTLYPFKPSPSCRRFFKKRRGRSYKIQLFFTRLLFLITLVFFLRSTTKVNYWWVTWLFNLLIEASKKNFSLHENKKHFWPCLHTLHNYLNVFTDASSKQGNPLAFN